MILESTLYLNAPFEYFILIGILLHFQESVKFNERKSTFLLLLLLTRIPALLYWVHRGLKSYDGRLFVDYGAAYCFIQGCLVSSSNERMKQFTSVRTAVLMIFFFIKDSSYLLPISILLLTLYQ